MPLANVWDDKHFHLKSLTDDALLSVARNECAQYDYRKLATEILIVRKSPKAKHEDLREFVQELEIELDGIEFDHPAPSGPGPLTASVTTETMFDQGGLPKVFTEFDEIEGPKSDETPIPEKRTRNTKPKPEEPKSEPDTTG